MDCTKCPDYDHCVSLCPEAEKFVGQDRVCYGKSGVIIKPRKKRFGKSSDGNTWLELMAYYNRHVEVPAPAIDMADFEHLMQFNFSKKQLSVILRYFVFGDSLGEIARDAGVSRQATFKRLRSAANVIKDVGDRKAQWGLIANRFDLIDGNEYRKHRLILFLYFFETIERQEIADRMDLSFPYVCKLFNEACLLVDQKVDMHNNGDTED